MTSDDKNNKPIWFFHPPLYYSIRQWFLHYFGGLYNRIEEHHIFLLSGGLSFSLFVCMVPVILVMFAVLGAILERSILKNEITIIISRIIPYETYSETIKQLILNSIEDFRVYRKVAGIIGAGGLLFAASSLFSSIRTILNQVFISNIQKHALVGKLRDFGMILAVMVYVVFSITILPVLEIVKDSATNIELLQFLKLSAMERLSFSVVSFVFVFSVFFALYYLIPYEKLQKRVVALSALWAAVLWEIAKQGFGYYITHVATIKAIYGTYVFLIIVAFWFYYSSIVFIVGAEIGQLFRERKRE
ncbi:MAG: YihY/virulence factor BrkB family protein [candidate division Zixibacteria bacterium]|nr:YihY/virulence factor BrkB family protein [candidate division Zixibacteria bacterium]